MSVKIVLIKVAEIRFHLLFLRNLLENYNTYIHFCNSFYLIFINLLYSNNKPEYSFLFSID